MSFFHFRPEWLFGFRGAGLRLRRGERERCRPSRSSLTSARGSRGGEGDGIVTLAASRTEVLRKVPSEEVVDVQRMLCWQDDVKLPKVSSELRQGSAEDSVVPAARDALSNTPGASSHSLR